MKTLFLLSLMFLTACAPSKGDKNVGEAQLPESDLAVVADEVCAQGQRLEVVDSEDVELSDLKPAIAFSSGDGECALKAGIDDEWWDLFGKRSFFQLENSGCIPNHSVWKTTRTRTSDGEVILEYVDVSNVKKITLIASENIGATYARDHAGIRALQCIEIE